MPFTAEEKVKIRHHMGYLNVSEVSTFQMGIPAAVETQYLIETAMNKVLVEAEQLVRDCLVKMDLIESQMIEDLELLSVEQVDTIRLSPKEMPRLRREYKHWQLTLANVLGIPPNPNDQRNIGHNLRVAH